MENKETRIVGFDCGQAEHLAVLLNEDGEIVRKERVTNRRDLVEAALRSFLEEIGPERDLVVVVESPHSHGRLVADAARVLTCDLWQVNTVALNHYRSLEGQPRKDDEWDAYLAARMAYLRTRGCRRVRELSNDERVLRRLTRLHGRLTEERKEKLSRVQALLLELAPEMLQSGFPGPKVGSKTLLRLMKKWPAFCGMGRAHVRSIEGILKRSGLGSKKEEVARVLQGMARRIKVSEGERRIMAEEMQVLTAGLSACEASLARFKEEIAEIVENHRVAKKLLEIPGIGALTAAVLVAELLPVAREATEAQSATYAGVTPTARKSGTSLDTSRLARGVNKHVLAALYRSCIPAVRCSTIDKAYYQKKLRGYSGHPKPHVAAFIALSRQRHKVIYKLMTTDATYDKEVLFSQHLDRLERAPQADDMDHEPVEEKLAS